MNFLESNQKLIYIKRSGTKEQYRYWYWHRKLKQIVGQPKPETHTINIHPKYPHHPKEQPREFQVGDVVFHFPKMQFAVLIGYKGGFWQAQSRLGNLWKCRTASLEFIFDNLIGGKTDPIEPNLVGAQTQAELDFAERLGQYVIENYIKKALPNIRIGEKTLQRLHCLMFRYVYKWAGQYRTEDLVVSQHESPTLDWEKVPTDIQIFFKKFSNLLRNAHKSQPHLEEALLELHIKLAWIHPFKDGNGRVIRLMLYLLALEWGYQINWSFDSGKKIRYYHYAVRRAVHRNNRYYLRQIIRQSLVQCS
jgi:cell filamentation protein